MVCNRIKTLHCPKESLKETASKRKRKSEGDSVQTSRVRRKKQRPKKTASKRAASEGKQPIQNSASSERKSGKDSVQTQKKVRKRQRPNKPRPKNISQSKTAIEDRAKTVIEDCPLLISQSKFARSIMYTFKRSQSQIARRIMSTCKLITSTCKSIRCNSSDVNIHWDPLT